MTRRMLLRAVTWYGVGPEPTGFVGLPPTGYVDRYLVTGTFRPVPGS